MTRVCVGVCTAKRPKLLTQCLASLLRQEISAENQVDIVVIDNNSAPDAAPIVAELDPPHPIRLHHVHEPRPGIPIARNRALEVALELDAELMAFIDDDEIAGATWVREMIAACERHGADVVQGHVNYVYPEDVSALAWKRQRRIYEEGQPLELAWTNNVIFRRWLVAPEGANLRFDEAFLLTGGSDRDFFARAHHKGAKIVFTRQADLTELGHRERMTFRRQFLLEMRIAATRVMIDRKLGKNVRSPLGHIVGAMKTLGNGVLRVLTSPFFLFYGVERFKLKVFRGTNRIARGIGTIFGLFERPPRMYQRLSGS